MWVKEPLIDLLTANMGVKESLTVKDMVEIKTTVAFPILL